MNAKTLVLLAAAIASLAQQSTPPLASQTPQTARLAPGGTGVIVGRVIDPRTSQPVPEAIVSLLVGDVTSMDGGPRVMSDSQGRYYFVNVPAGRYRLRAEKNGYIPGLHGQKLRLDEGRDVDVIDGQRLTDVLVPIWKFVAIGGTVTDEAGDPVVGVNVYAFKRTVRLGESQFIPGVSATTDDRGVYRLSIITAGEYVVAVVSTLTTFPVEAVPDVGDASNQQVGDVILLTRRTAPLPPPPTDTSVPAVYRTTFAPAAARPGDATVIALGWGEERSNVNIRLTPVRAVRVSGRLLAPTGVVRPTAIRLIASGESLISTSPGFDAATGLSNAAGNFSLLGVPEGQYFLWVETPRPPTGSPAGAQPYLWANEPVTVGTSDLLDVAVNLRPPPRLTLRVDVRGGRPVPDGSVRALVQAIGVGGAASLTPPRPNQPVTVEMPPGRYLVSPTGPSDVACTSLSGGRDVSDEPLILATDDVEVTIVCGDAPNRLSGTVRTDRGTLDPDALVVVFPTERRYWSGADLRPRRLTSARPSTTGSFSMVNLPAGEYFIAAIPVETSELWQDSRRLEALTRIAQRFSIAQAESRAIDLHTARSR